MMWIFILLFVYSPATILVNSQVCNPIECFGFLNKVFHDADGKDSCVKMAKIENCVGLCYSSNLHENSLIDGIQEVKQEICVNDQENKLYNKCVDKHKYLLLSCLYESFNIKAVRSDVDPKLLMCRKITEAQHCDLSTLVTCSLHADYIVEVLLEKLFKPLHTEYCTFTTKQIYEINVTYPVFANDYKNLALCFDANSHLIDDCVLHKGVKNSVMSSFFSYKLCKSVESFIDCLQGVVKNRCHDHEATFRLISYSLYQNILPKCFPFTDSNNKASKGRLANGKYAMASGIHSKNSSDKIVVNQHIDQPNSQSVLIDFLNVFCILIPFIQFLIYDHFYLHD